METVILNSKKDPAFAEKAAALLAKGETVVIPTETVYGLAANALDAAAVKKIYEAKGRPSDNPLIVHIADFSDIYPLVREVPEAAVRLAKAFWPGPLTIILPKSDRIPDRTSGGLPTVAIRMPAHPDATAVIRACGFPLAAPSANISGFPSPTRPEHVTDDMVGRVPMIIDGGDCEVGVESTVITLATALPTVLRPGGITPEQLESVIGKVLVDKAVLNPLASNAEAASPGMKYKHYAPHAHINVYCGTQKGYLRYLERRKDSGIFALCYEETEPLCPTPAVTMGRRSDPFSQTHRLFDALRELDEKGAEQALAECPEQSGVGLAVCNRLFRAAAFRFVREAPIIGLTGQTGSGKSTVAEVFRSCGYAIVDCDRIAHTITESGSSVLSELAEAFGADILNPDGTLDRRRLAERAFSSPENTKKLNSVTHPVILRETRRIAFSACEKNIPCVIDAPLLFQCGLDAVCDVTIAVTAPENVRVERLIRRDGISSEAVKNRIGAQEPEAYYTAKADIILKNDLPDSLRNEAFALARRLTECDEKK